MSGASAAAVTACVIAFNEERHLTELLPTLRWADEVLVVIDAKTTDRSAEVAQAHADRVAVRAFESYPAQRNAALDLARCPWVFFVDADERVSPALAAEVREAVQVSCAGQGVDGYWVPRQNLIFGRVMRGAGWSPDHQLRLLRRERARYDESRLVHEVVQLQGGAGYLVSPLVHLNYQSFRQFLDKQRRYTALEAAVLRAQAALPRRRAFIGQPLREFWRRYVELDGWRDGWVGLVLAVAMAGFAFERVRLARSAAGSSR